MDVKSRIQKYLDVKGIKTTTFEKEVGLSNGYWRKTKSISANVLTDIIKKYSDLSIDYALGLSEKMCCSTVSDEEIFGTSSSVPGNGLTTDSQRTHNGGTSDDALATENAMLKKLLEEKERTIQLLLSQRESKA